MARGRWLAGVLACGVALAVAAPVWACALDNKPSMLANGTAAHFNGTTPTKKTFATWAPFVFPTSYGVAGAVRFAEDPVEIRRSLTPSALSHPWRWSFGDGGTATGYAVTHTYRRPGTYKVTAQAYFSAPGYHQWLEFDAVTIRIR